ncbi:MAG: glycine--tRNA ligase [Anaplasmataceae bacterium]|nr:glycine--tRNA ligase [Anaplasmataceae bacterium]
MEKTEQNLMDKVLSLAKRRGFVFPSSEIYGGLANTWDYGPVGAQLKKNIKDLWWRMFVESREDVVGIDAALLMNPKVWEASGHLKEFSDPLVECKKCHGRMRADTLEGDECPYCGEKNSFTEAKQFNLMLKTFLGPAEEQANVVYFRPETAQAMFVDFKNVIQSTRVRIPFGIAQMGKAFRNEITPGNFIFRTREFEQMEIEYFVNENTWAENFEHWREEMWKWMKAVGIDENKVHELEIPDGDRAHYSKRTIDFEFDYPFGRKELYGLAYRTNFDLTNHENVSGENLKYRDPETGEEYLPHVIEPTWGVDRTILAVLLSSYKEDGERVYLALPPRIAPYKAAVFPLLANKPELVKKAREIFDNLKMEFPVIWDDRGNIGKRYYAQDEIGTPFCITVDFDSLEKNDVTIRNRDTGMQDRIEIDRLIQYVKEAI